MLKKIMTLLLALVLTVCLFPTAKICADDIEYAWYPVSVMRITQIAYENYSHQNSNAFDCTGTYGDTEVYMFAPFTGKIVYLIKDYSLVLFQSDNEVKFADGSKGYMTVQIMHSSNYEELKSMKEKCDKGYSIKQGEKLCKIGGTGINGKNAYDTHFEIGVARGQVYKTVPKYSETFGNVYGFDAFYINTEKTTDIVNMGVMNPIKKLIKDDVEFKDGKTDWRGLWKALDPSTIYNISMSGLPYKLSTNDNFVIKNHKTPTKLSPGEPYSISGEVSSNTIIDLLTVRVVNTDGILFTSKTVFPNAKSYSIANLDKFITFDKLPIGSYRYQIIAVDKSGKKILVDKEFYVGTPTPTKTIPPTPTKKITPTPTTKITPTPTKKITPTPTTKITPTPTKKITPTPTKKITPTPTKKITPTPTKKITPTPTKKITPTPTKKITPTPTVKINVTYQVYDYALKKWWPNVTNTQDYAGKIGNSISGIYANLSSGNITYKVHCKGGSWLPAVTNRSDYAGNLNKPIDGLMMTTNTGKTIHYQVHLKSSNRWLPYVTGYNENDSKNGYAGILGEEIDAVRIYID